MSRYVHVGVVIAEGISEEHGAAQVYALVDGVHGSGHCHLGWTLDRRKRRKNRGKYKGPRTKKKTHAYTSAPSIIFPRKIPHVSGRGSAIFRFAAVHNDPCKTVGHSSGQTVATCVGNKLKCTSIRETYPIYTCLYL